jgi:hypothetical protein
MCCLCSSEISLYFLADQRLETELHNKSTIWLIFLVFFGYSIMQVGTRTRHRVGD